MDYVRLWESGNEQVVFVPVYGLDSPTICRRAEAQPT